MMPNFLIGPVVVFETMCVLSLSQLGAAYISATTGAVVTALGLKTLAKVLLLHEHSGPAGLTHHGQMKTLTPFASPTHLLCIP